MNKVVSVTARVTAQSEGGNWSLYRGDAVLFFNEVDRLWSLVPMQQRTLISHANCQKIGVVKVEIESEHCSKKPMPATITVEGGHLIVNGSGRLKAPEKPSKATISTADASVSAEVVDVVIEQATFDETDNPIAMPRYLGASRVAATINVKTDRPHVASFLIACHENRQIVTVQAACEGRSVSCEAAVKHVSRDPNGVNAFELTSIGTVEVRECAA